jgi:hypothetical protein
MTLDSLGEIAPLINGALIPVLIFGANSVSKRISSIEGYVRELNEKLSMHYVQEKHYRDHVTNFQTFSTSSGARLNDLEKRVAVLENGRRVDHE